jgi:hypothetical protein
VTLGKAGSAAGSASNGHTEDGISGRRYGPQVSIPIQVTFDCANPDALARFGVRRVEHGATVLRPPQAGQRLGEFRAALARRRL